MAVYTLSYHSLAPFLREVSKAYGLLGLHRSVCCKGLSYFSFSFFPPPPCQPSGEYPEKLIIIVRTRARIQELMKTGDPMEDGAPKDKAELQAETYVWNGLYTNTQKGKQQRIMCTL